MKVFVASLATETNTFSPVPTDRANFIAAFYAPPGHHPATPTLCSAVFPALRERAREEGFELVEGTATWAEPGGLVQRQTYETLRDEILDQLRAAAPVDAVVLGLHGAMVAQGYDDCEGDLAERVREIVGPDVIVGATFDPHSHLTPKRVENLNILNAFLEFPHTDFVERAEQVVDLTLRAVRLQIKPVISVFDCRMIDVLPTSQQPMRGFVDSLRAMEGRGSVLSVSLIHGFLAGDVPELGARLVVVTDNDLALGDRLAREKGMELFAMRGSTRMTQHDIPDALRLARACATANATKPVVLADTWDNPGGGVAGDGTLILRAMLDAGMDDVGVATIWDPVAVTFCLAAGDGATIRLRFGGKSGPGAGDPIDATVTVLKAVDEAWESFGASRVPLGPSAVIRIAGTCTDVILNTNRTQTFDPDIFSGLGVDISQKKYLVVKSTNHFYAAFRPVASEIFYVDAGTHYPSDARRTDYVKVKRPLWPIVDDPHAASA
ncbi:M81 family metallopeptidase [Acetobacter sacchari]|uniref:Microcystinase C n=1 Tax=Acetobacter sacchari TaxID=2661687 RepID=A0ABS3LXZ9_9PROT|nr:M81 family metallopeptidase [Acetobacter sacchari]MBO1360721.1 M81 family metallopeptidase [Acetobacter sacchari]